MEIKSNCNPKFAIQMQPTNKKTKSRIQYANSGQKLWTKNLVRLLLEPPPPKKGIQEAYTHKCIIINEIIKAIVEANFQNDPYSSISDILHFFFSMFALSCETFCRLFLESVIEGQFSAN